MGVRFRDDVGRKILGVHLLAEGYELRRGIDRSNWKVLTGDRKTPRRTQRHTLFRENNTWAPASGGAPTLPLGRCWGWVGWTSLEQNGMAADVVG